jgi:hypothetical protein
MVLKSREKILIFFVVLAIVIWAFDHFYYTPQKKKILRLKEEIKSADLKLKESLIFDQGVEVVESETEVSRMEKELQMLTEHTLRGEKFRIFLKHLAKDSDRLQMKIISMDIKEDKISQPEKEKTTFPLQYSKVTVLMVLYSTYNAIEAYVKSIEELPFIVSVDRLQVEKNDSTLPVLKVTMWLNVLIRSVPEGAEK